MPLESPTAQEELAIHSPLEWSIFKQSYESIYLNLTSLNKILFTVGVSFHSLRIIATITIVTIYFTSQPVNGLAIALVIWTVIGLVNLLFPLYFTIRQDHFEIRENIIFEKMKQSCHSAFDYPYFFIFIYQW
jgi:hypothetical protein